MEGRISLHPFRFLTKSNIKLGTDNYRYIFYVFYKESDCLPANLVPRVSLVSPWDRGCQPTPVAGKQQPVKIWLSLRFLSLKLLSNLDGILSLYHADNFGVFCCFAGHESEGEDSEPDLFQCGKCKRMFTSLQKYLKHKAAKDCSQLQSGQRSTISPVTNGEVLTWSIL